MKITKHCQLCDHQIVDFKTGTLCGLTNRKPDFTNTCAKAKLDSKLRPKIESTNIEYETILKTKTLVYINFVIFLVVGIAVILAGYFLAQYLLKFRVIAAVPFIISAIGLMGVLPLAIGPLNQFRNDLKLAKAKKDDVDNVLKIYNIKYNIDLTFGDKYHGVQDVGVDLNIKK